MDAILAARIDYILKKYRTINGVPVENLSERQINAIYYALKERRKRPVKVAPPETEHQMTIWEL